VNFLAHFHLAWPDPGLIAGGLEGDYYKGPLCGHMARDLEAGVRLHRAVDAFTDDHPEVRALRARFPRDLRRYAGILIDLGFDHYLSRHWQRYSDLSLPAFNREVHLALAAQAPRLSPAAQRMRLRMQEHDLLNRYLDWDLIPASAERIGSRLRRGNPLTGIGPSLAPLRPAMESAFLAFYPDLLAFSAERRAALAASAGEPPGLHA